MPISSALVTRFFQLIAHRKFAEAERELERIRQKMHNTEWNKGYSRALKGMLVARKSNNDQSLLMSKLDLNDKKLLQDYRKEFRSHVRNKLHGDFDRGYFSAWADCMRVLSKFAFNNSTTEISTSRKGKEREDKTVEKSERQVRIETFLNIES